ncbi:MAG: GSCFA domain-containing protein [Bacteroidota bacterium]|nr:GSCFA domain-containing protein [Bacteroidota bacterium]
MKPKDSNFRTLIQAVDIRENIDYYKKTMFIGSCFTENIGRRMQAGKFPTAVNPFGILYNPVSVKDALMSILTGADFDEDNLINHNGLWHSLMHHGSFSSKSKTECLSKINSALSKAGEFLKEAEFLFVTFGTAWLYEYKKTGEAVGNCHKLPAGEFDRRLLNADEITIEFYQLLNALESYNSDLKIVLSVSPVRHLKDGFAGNSLSKSILRVSAAQIAERFEHVHYFPSYEIMTDDLRDYRFYAKDMVHPSEQASDYIFDFFSETFFNTETKQRLKEISAIVHGANHRVLHPGSSEYQAFLDSMQKKIAFQKEKQPALNFSEEEEYFSGLKQ